MAADTIVTLDAVAVFQTNGYNAVRVRVERAATSNIQTSIEYQLNPI